MNCPVCLNPSTRPALSGKDFLFETTDKEFKLNSCAACHCMFLNPLPDADEIAGFYPVQYWWTAARPSLLKRLESVYRRTALHDHVSFITTAASGLPNRHAGRVRLLDVGCGSATLLALLKRRGFDVVGLDASSEAARVAAVENGVRVIVGKLPAAALEGGEFDMVTLFHVIEHVTNPREVLEEVRRILKPEGIVVLQAPNIDSWQFHWFGAKWYGLDIPRHVVDYSRQAIVTLLENTGFTVKRIRHFNLRDNAQALASSLFPSLDPLSRPSRLRQRNASEPAMLAWTKHILYLFLVLVAYPAARLEAAFGHGATVTIEAKRELESRHDY